MREHNEAGWPSEEDLARAFGFRLRALRKERSLSQTELARLVGLTKSSIAKYEAGVHTPPVSVLLRLGAGLSTTFDYLLGAVAGGPPPIRDAELVGCLREVAAMDEGARRPLMTVLRGLITAYRESTRSDPERRTH
jgi:transcriptional regulator with XRE-family HTH domain